MIFLDLTVGKFCSKMSTFKWYSVSRKINDTRQSKSSIACEKGDSQDIDITLYCI